MDELERLIRGSYGSADNIFSNHPNDSERARLAIVEAGNQHVSFEGYLQLHRNYLEERSCSEEHIDEQIKRVQNLELYF